MAPSSTGTELKAGRYAVIVDEAHSSQTGEAAKNLNRFSALLRKRSPRRRRLSTRRPRPPTTRRIS
jgi:hypothetical protein